MNIPTDKIEKTITMSDESQYNYWCRPGPPLGEVEDSLCFGFKI